MRLIFAWLAIAAMPAAAQERSGEELYMDYCATCHGAAGTGDGPLAPLLTVPPPDLTGLSQRAGGGFPAFEVVRRIDRLEALPAHGGGMPPWGDIFSGEPVGAVATGAGQPILTAETIAKVTEYLRSIQR